MSNCPRCGQPIQPRGRLDFLIDVVIVAMTISVLTLAPTVLIVHIYLTLVGSP